MERDCKTCIYANYKNKNDNGCTRWDCEYINKQEAIDAWKRLNVIHCKDCKHYGIKHVDGWDVVKNGGLFTACFRDPGCGPIRKPEDFCIYGERRAEE